MLFSQKKIFMRFIKNTMIISPIKISEFINKYNSQNNINIPLIFNGGFATHDKLDLSFCGVFENKTTPIKLEQAQCYSGVHCPSCGTQMLTPQDYELIKEKAKNIKSAEEWVNLLRENKKFIPKKFRHIFKDIENINNYKELSVLELFKEMSEISFHHKKNTVREIKDYMKIYSQDFPQDRQIKAIDILDEIRTKQTYNLQKDKIMLFADTLGLNKEQKNVFASKILRLLFNSNGYYMLFNSSELSQIPQENLAEYVIQRIFYPSLSEIAPISKYPKHKDLPNNSILLCKNCYPMQVKNIFWQNTDLREIKDNLRAYLTDISYLMGGNKIDNAPEYINSLIYSVNIMSKQKIEFTPNEIKSIKSVERLMKRHVSFAPIEQTEVDIPCAECGSTMLTHTKRKEIEYELKKCDTPYEYANVLRNNMKYIGVHNKVLAEIFLSIVEKNPNISDEEFLKKYARQEAHYCEKSVEQAISGFLVNRSYVAEHYPKEGLNIYDIFTSRLLKYVSEGKFKNYELTPLYKECLENLDFQNYPVRPIFVLLRNLKSIAYKHMYVNEEEKSKYNDKAGVYSLLFRLFQQNVATADHLVPEIKGGEGDKYNLIGLCKSCNKLKSRKDVNNWYSENKKLADNLKKQLIVVNNMSKSGQLDGYEDWAEKIAQKVYELTYHRLDLRNQID